MDNNEMNRELTQEEFDDIVLRKLMYYQNKHGSPISFKNDNVCVQKLWVGLMASISDVDTLENLCVNEYHIKQAFANALKQ